MIYNLLTGVVIEFFFPLWILQLILKSLYIFLLIYYLYSIVLLLLFSIIVKNEIAYETKINQKNNKNKEKISYEFQKKIITHKI